MKSLIYNIGFNPALSLRSATSAVIASVLIASMPLASIAQNAIVASSGNATVFDAGTAPASPASVPRTASDAKTLHVTVGHSVFIDTRSRLRRVYVADPTVLNSVTLTPNEIIVTAMSPGVSSLTLLDEAGQAQSYVISADVDIDGLRTAMSEAMRGNGVKVEGSAGRVTLSGFVATQALADSAVKLASLYSKEVGNALTISAIHPKQVRLEVRILEVDRSKLQQYGINLFNPGGNTSFLAATTTAQYPSAATLGGSTSPGAIGNLVVSNPLNFMLYSAKLNLGATIQDLQTKQILQILAEPTITTISGQKADFLSGGEFPFPIVQPGSGGSAPIVTVTFRPYGVKVEFTPEVNEDGTIRLKVAPEVSALDYTNSVSVSGTTVPAISTRRAETEVELRSNQSFAISGLLDQRTTDILSKTPGAANIPILGALFKSKNVNHSTTELVVVVTPTVVDPLSETSPPSQPDLPIPTLNTGAFDQSLGKNRSPQPGVPPLNPDAPQFGEVQPPVPSAAPQPVPASAAAINATPAQTHPAPAKKQSAPVSKAAPGTVSQPTAPIAPKHQPTAAPAPGSPGVTASAAGPGKAGHNSIVEIMTLSHESDVDPMVAALHRRGYDVAVSQDTQSSLLHLNVGPFASTKDAEKMRQRLLQDGYDATIK